MPLERMATMDGSERSEHSSSRYATHGHSRSSELVPMPPRLAKAMGLIGRGKAKREDSGASSGPSAEERDGRMVSTGQPRDYEVELWTHFRPTLSVERPYAYLLPPEFSKVVDVLDRHGIRMEALVEEAELPVEVYRIDELQYAERPFQNHRPAKVSAAPRAETRRVPAGTIVVRTAQPLGALACYLLEPQCEDGLTTWNFFDAGMTVGGDFPVVRIVQAVELPTRSVRPLTWNMEQE